jgi:hypothetical protein
LLLLELLCLETEAANGKQQDEAMEAWRQDSDGAPIIAACFSSSSSSPSAAQASSFFGAFRSQGKYVHASAQTYIRSSIRVFTYGCTYPVSVHVREHPYTYMCTRACVCVAIRKRPRVREGTSTYAYGSICISVSVYVCISLYTEASDAEARDKLIRMPPLLLSDLQSRVFDSCDS